MAAKRTIEGRSRDVVWISAWRLIRGRWTRSAAVQGIGYTPVYGPTVKGR